MGINIMEITSKEKQKLKGLAHSIKPSVIIGKEGVSRVIIDSINNILNHNELIKIKFNEFKNEKDILSKKIQTSCDANIIGMIGNTLILYKQNSDIDRRKYLID
tara:strand:- start:165 stop:476 length:312 start_codon:yes stop_codon:yes gene_type:complete